MEKANLYYKESGVLGKTGPLYMGGLGLIASLGLGAIYAYTIFYIPLIYISFLITIGFGIAMGFVIGKAAVWGKVRSQKSVAMFAVLAGVLAVFFSWVFWIQAYADFLSFSVLEVMNSISQIAEEGVWAVFDIAPSGIALYLIWLVEAGIIIGGTVLVAMGNATGMPYCENCDKWVDSEVVSSQLSRIPHRAKFVEAIENHDFTSLTSLEKVGHGIHQRTKLTLASCKQCNKEHYLTVIQIETEIDDEGKREEKENELVENLIINEATYQALKEWNKALV